MEYKVSNTPLKLREYGRNIQMMVEQAKLIDNDEIRNVLVHEIVRIMTNLNPQWKDIQDYRQKVWDHLYYLADFNINVDSDFPMPDPETFKSRPVESMGYHMGKPRFRQYGKNVDLMIEKAVEMEDGPEKDALITLIANIMRMHLKYEDRDTNAGPVVVEHMKVISGGKIDVHADDIRFYKIKPQPPQQQQQHHNQKKGKKKKKSGRNKRY